MFRIVSVVLLLAVLPLGCSRKPGGAVDVAGTITLDGKPIEGVEVYFASEKFEGFGKTDAAGKYRLVNGAVPGSNKVFLKKSNIQVQGAVGIDTSIPGMDAKQVEAFMAAQNKGKGGQSKISMIPSEYSDPSTTKLTFNVPDGGSSAADFRISSQ